MKFHRKTSIDRLYFWLGMFTDVYLILISYDFFSNLHLTHPTLERMLNALSEPYLGALAVYVVLKEIRKRRSDQPASLYHGERYVITWLALLAVTTAAVMSTERYAVDAAYQTIVANSLAAFMVYLGARINRP